MRYVFSLTFLFFCTVIYSQSPTCGLADAVGQSQTRFVNSKFALEITEAEKAIARLMQERNIPGLSVAVATKNDIIWAEGFGYSDLENKVPVRINSKFRIGSISKTLTSLAVGKLIETNQVELSDDIRKYVPYFPVKKHPVSIGQLASHVAGIRDYNYTNGEYLSNKNYESVQESVDVFKADSLLFEPGTEYLYSTYGYVLLSAAIEGITQMNFTDFMRDSILIPLNLNNTLPDFNYAIIENRVRFYDEFGGTIINSYSVDNSNKWAGGGYLSTPLDLVHLYQGLDKFLKESTIHKLWTPATLKNGGHTNYGIGWRIDRDNSNRTYVHHGGSSVGGRSFLLVYPDEEISIALVCNLGGGFDQEFVLKIAEIFLK